MVYIKSEFYLNYQYIMSFRTSDNLQRYEYVRFHLDNVIEQPANNQSQKKTGYRFTINDRSTMFDFFNGFFEVTKELQKKANGAGYAQADRITMINGSSSLIKHMVIKSSGKIVYESDNLHRITNVKNLLEYSDDFSRSVGKNSFWYLDTDGTTADTNTGFEARRILTQAVQNDGGGGAKSINEMIPLNRYSFFQELERKMLPPMQLTFELTLNEDSEMIHMANGTDAGRVVVKRLYLWLPRLIPKDSMYSNFVSEFLKPTTWTYMRDLYNQSANTRAIQNMFQISPAIDNVKHVFIYLQRTDGPNNDEAERSPYVFDTFKLNAANANSSLSSCRLEYGNNTFYPELEYDADSKIRIFNDLMSYAFRKNDYNSGTQLNVSNFSSLYGLIYFDLTYQKEVVTRDPKQLILHYRLNVAPAANVRAHSIVFYESEVVVKTVGNELMIV